MCFSKQSLSFKYTLKCTCSGMLSGIHFTMMWVRTDVQLWERHCWSQVMGRRGHCTLSACVYTGSYKTKQGRPLCSVPDRRPEACAGLPACVPSACVPGAAQPGASWLGPRGQGGGLTEDRWEGGSAAMFGSQTSQPRNSGKIIRYWCHRRVGSSPGSPSGSRCLEQRAKQDTEIQQKRKAL